MFTFTFLCSLIAEKQSPFATALIPLGTISLKLPPRLLIQELLNLLQLKSDVLL